MLPFAVIEKSSGRAVGMTTFMNIDAANRHLEIGSTWYRKRVQRSALNTECKLLDGVFLAAHSAVLLQQRLLFDEIFDFHFYDLDLCRQAERQGVRMGTAPICSAPRGAPTRLCNSWRSDSASRSRRCACANTTSPSAVSPSYSRARRTTGTPARLPLCRRPRRVPPGSGWRTTRPTT